MRRYLLRRVAAALLTVWVTTVAVSMLIHLVPGDPVQLMYAQSQATTPAQLAAIRHHLGLDKPPVEQYLLYMGRILHGNFGRTIRGDQPVLGLLLGHLPNTLLLAGTSLVFAALTGIGLGFIAAYRRGSIVDTGLMVTAILGASMPSFWLGLMLLFVFSVQLGWLPVATNNWQALILPAATLGLSNAAIVARLTRSSMIEIFDHDYIRTAWAKGLPKMIVLHRHALRAGMVPVMTMLGLQFAYMMGGAIVVEDVFAWNGIGRVAIQAIFQRDYPLIQGFILVFACVVVLVSLAVDLLNAWLDPRIRLS